MSENEATQRAQACATRMYAADRASQALGITVTVNAPGAAEAVMQVNDTMLNGQGVCHGGHIFALADTAFAFACNGYDDVTVAGAASIDFLRPGHAGDTLTAVASERHRGRRHGVYDVSVHNQHGKAVALFRGKSVASGRKMLAAAQ